MSKNPDLPNGIGPHEGRELALMLAGKKPLAMFSDIIPASGRIPEEIIPEEAFRPHVAAGCILMRVETYRDPADPQEHCFVYYALPEEAWRIEAIHRIDCEIFTGRREPPRPTTSRSADCWDTPKMAIRSFRARKQPRPAL